MTRYGYLDKFEKHETPVGDWSPKSHAGHGRLYEDHNVPVNDYQALMEALPLQHPRMTEHDRETDWAAFTERIEQAGLTERETVVIDAMVYGGMSLFETAQHLARCEGSPRAVSKTEIARIRDRAYTKLRKVFKEEE